MTCASARFQRMSRHKKRTIEEPPGHHKARMYTNQQREHEVMIFTLKQKTIAYMFESYIKINFTAKTS